MNPLTQSKNTTILPVLIALMLGCFALSPQARAVCQEGCDIPNLNTFLGDDALVNNLGGGSNTAVGWSTLSSNTNGSWNTAIGSGALRLNTSGYDNTAIGVTALESNTSGHSNTATGRDALLLNTTGIDNTATGAEALVFNTTGKFNVADGMFALSGNQTGGKNTATGFQALAGNTTGNRNTATGFGALAGNTTGTDNIALGFSAGTNLTTGGRNIDIGNPGVAGESGSIRIGTAGDQTATFIAGIAGATVADGVGVIVNTHGRLGTINSSARYKDQIKPMDKASEAILALKPVTFRYKKDLDPEGIQQFGLVAEQVEKVNPDLVARNQEGKAYTVRYEAVNTMLLNEFLKEHHKVEEQSSQIAKQDCKVQKLEATVVQLQSALKEQAAQIRKVSDQLSATEPAARLVTNQ
jgi:uncharacterized coiled-coil protein SlyX